MEISPIKLEILKKYGTQGRFSFAAEIDEAVVSKIVNGVRRPNEHQRQTFARLLDIPAERLFKD